MGDKIAIISLLKIYAIPVVFCADPDPIFSLNTDPDPGDNVDADPCLL